MAHTATYDITFSGLLGGTTASHTHSRTPGQLGPNFTVATTTPTYTGFPSGVMAGTYHHVFDTSLATSYNPNYVTAFGGVPQAEAALLAGEPASSYQHPFQPVQAARSAATGPAASFRNQRPGP